MVDGFIIEIFRILLKQDRNFLLIVHHIIPSAQEFIFIRNFLQLFLQKKQFLHLPVLSLHLFLVQLGIFNHQRILLQP